MSSGVPHPSTLLRILFQKLSTPPEIEGSGLGFISQAISERIRPDTSHEISGIEFFEGRSVVSSAGMLWSGSIRRAEH